MDIQIKEKGKYKFIDEGTGRPIVVLHGLFGALSNFDELIARFKSSYRVIVPLMPLYDMPLVKTGVPSLSKFILSFISEMGLTDIILLGNSLGGHVCRPVS